MGEPVNSNFLQKHKDQFINKVTYDFESRLLIETLENFSILASRYGYSVHPYSARSLQKLSTLPEERKISIRLFYENWISWIEPEDSSTHEIQIDLEKEKSFLKRALDHYNLRVHDDFWATLQTGQLIEIYGTDMVQIYRNLEFLRYCSYSLLDISVFEWYNLWTRPTQILEAMLKCAEQAMNHPTPVLPYSVPRHVLRETQPATLDEPQPRIACLVDFHHIGSVFNKFGFDLSPRGAIATSSGEIISIGDEASKIQFV